jgi:hypothetical protein
MSDRIEIKGGLEREGFFRVLFGRDVSPGVSWDRTDDESIRPLSINQFVFGFYSPPLR